jgi:hypothetical protein
MPLTLEQLLERQKAWSEHTFGPGDRTKGVCAHLRKEVDEAEADPRAAGEWADIIILAMDGAWRCGITGAQLAEAVKAKQDKNARRLWPDWRTASPDAPIEHVRGHED